MPKVLTLFSNAYAYLLFSKLCWHNLPPPLASSLCPIFVLGRRKPEDVAREVRLHTYYKVQIIYLHCTRCMVISNTAAQWFPTGLCCSFSGKGRHHAVPPRSPHTKVCPHIHAMPYNNNYTVYITKKAPHARALTRNTKLVAHLDDIRYGISGAASRSRPGAAGLGPSDRSGMGKERARDYEKGKV